MRRLYLLLITPLLLTTACQRVVESQDLGIIFNSACDMTPTFAAEGGDYHYYFTSEHDWHVECFDEWVSVSPSSGTPLDESFVVSVKGHEATKDRTSHIMVHLANGRSVDIPILQLQHDHFVATEATVFRIDSAGGDVVVEIDTNLEYTVSLPKGIEWLTLDETRSVRTDRLHLTATPNNTDHTRVAHIVLYDVRYDKPALHEFSIVQYTDVAATNEIQYTTIDNRPVTCNITQGYGATFMLHYWEDGVGRIIFNDIVRAIPDNALRGRSTINSITLPATITHIGSHALAGCTNIEDITLPAKVASIGGSALEGCHGELVALGKLPNMGCDTTHEEHWLHGSMFHSVTLHNRVGSNTFAEYTPLENLTLMPSVGSVGSNAFAGCHNLTTITSRSLEDWCAIDFDNSKANPISLEGANLTIGGNVVTELDTTDLDISAIGRHTFAHYDNLTSVTLGEAVVSIGRGAFEGCNLESITLGSGIASVGSGAFFGTSAERLSIAFNLPSFNNDCSYDNHWLYGINVHDIVVEDGVTTLGILAFSSLESLDTITLGDSVEHIGEGAFAHCTSLSHIILGKGITTLESHTLYGCTALRSITLPEGITTIEDNVFNGCISLAHITLPEGITAIGDYAFANCSSLATVWCYPTTPPALGNSYAFDYGCTISVPASAYEEYITAENWRRIADRVVGNL